MLFERADEVALVSAAYVCVAAVHTADDPMATMATIRAIDVKNFDPVQDKEMLVAGVSQRQIRAAREVTRRRREQIIRKLAQFTAHQTYNVGEVRDAS